MKFFVASFAVCLLVASPAAAQAPACRKPPPPVFPAASTLPPGALDQQRSARDAYFAAADRNLACLDADIDARMRALFASGAPMDATLRAQGLAHEQASRERAEVHERFLRMCLAYEDAHGSVPGGCAAPK